MGHPGNELITDAAGVGNVGLPVAVHVPECSTGHVELGLAEAAGISADSRPGADSVDYVISTVLAVGGMLATVTQYYRRTSE